MGLGSGTSPEGLCACWVLHALCCALHAMPCAPCLVHHILCALRLLCTMPCVHHALSTMPCAPHPVFTVPCVHHALYSPVPLYSSRSAAGCHRREPAHRARPRRSVRCFRLPPLGDSLGPWPHRASGCCSALGSLCLWDEALGWGNPGERLPYSETGHPAAPCLHCFGFAVPKAGFAAPKLSLLSHKCGFAVP